VVIDQFNVKRIHALKTKNNAPIRVNRDGPEFPEAAGKLVQTIPREVHRLRRFCLVEPAKNVIDPIPQIRPYSARVAELIKAFEAAVLETSYHKSIP
jgi:hypothetical protein